MRPLIAATLLLSASGFAAECTFDTADVITGTLVPQHYDALFDDNVAVPPPNDGSGILCALSVTIPERKAPGSWLGLTLKSKLAYSSTFSVAAPTGRPTLPSTLYGTMVIRRIEFKPAGTIDTVLVRYGGNWSMQVNLTWANGGFAQLANVMLTSQPREVRLDWNAPVSGQPVPIRAWIDKVAQPVRSLPANSVASRSLTGLISRTNIQAGWSFRIDQR